MSPLLPQQITLENYKPFRQPTTLHLRPLTLCYGPNNAGKSAALRVLRLLADSTERDLPAGLNLRSATLHGANFRDLIHKSLRVDDDAPPRRDFAFTLTWPPEAPLQSLRLTFYADPNPGPTAPPLIIRELHAQLQDGRAVTLLHTPSPARPDNSRAYRVSTKAETGATAPEVWLRFEGICPTLPDGLDATTTEALLHTATQLTWLRRGIDWLRTNRVTLERTRLLPIERPDRFATDGSNAADYLVTQPATLEACRTFFDAHLQRRLTLQPIPIPGEERFRVLLGALAAGSAEPRDTDLVDSGEGAIHLLPTLVALERLRNPDLHTPFPFALLLEEPETHLHPTLQRHLATHLADTAAQLGDRRLIIETHSEHILLGVRLQIARGRLRPEHVALHWVHTFEAGEAHLGLAELDGKGNLSGGWPFGAFEDLDQVARELTELQWEEDHARHAG